MLRTICKLRAAIRSASHLAKLFAEAEHPLAIPGGAPLGQSNGLETAELILALNNQRVRTPEEFQRALRAVPRGEVVQLRILNLQTGQTRIAFIRSRN